MDNKYLETIQMIMRQTTYTDIEAREKMLLFNNDPILVIKDFMGISEKKTVAISSLNQEIYKQLRSKLDASISEFNKKQEENLIRDLQ